MMGLVPPTRAEENAGVVPVPPGLQRKETGELDLSVGIDLVQRLRVGVQLGDGARGAIRIQTVRAKRIRTLLKDFRVVIKPQIKRGADQAVQMTVVMQLIPEHFLVRVGGD